MRKRSYRPAVESLEVRVVPHTAPDTIYTHSDHTINARYTETPESLEIVILDSGHGAATAANATTQVATPLAKTPMPNNADFAFLGAQPGQSVWVLDGGQVILPGFGSINDPEVTTFQPFDTGDARTGGLVAAWVRFTLIDVHGPNPNAHFSVYDFGGPGGTVRVWMATADGIGPTDVVYAQIAGESHIHPNIAFTGPGKFEVDLQATVFVDDGMGGIREVSSAVTTIKYQVQDSVVVTGADRGSLPIVRVRDALTGKLRLEIVAYELNFKGGVRVATGDVDNDGIFDIIVAPGHGRSADIRIYDSLTGALKQEIPSHRIYGANYKQGLYLAVGNFDRSAGTPGREIAVGPGGGKKPVVVFNLVDIDNPTTFFAYGPNYARGVRVASSNVDGHRTDEILTAPGKGRLVKVFEAQADLTNRTTGWVEHFRFRPVANLFSGGLYVAAGDFNQDGDRNEFVVSTGTRVKIFDYEYSANPDDRFITPLGSPLAFDTPSKSGVRLAIFDVNGDGFDDIIFGGGKGGRGRVRILSSPMTERDEPPMNHSQFPALAEMAAYWALEGTGLDANVFVAGGRY
jgi:hypothetical protein